MRERLLAQLARRLEAAGWTGTVDDVDSVDTMLATLPDGRTLSWSPHWPYLNGDRALVAEAHAWLADRS
jgi:hypothetical protein